MNNQILGVKGLKVKILKELTKLRPEPFWVLSLFIQSFLPL